MTKKANKKELDEIYNKISDENKNEATLIYNELSFILETLETLKQEIKTKGATEHFINGKQDFLRESPSLSSYNKLMKTYDIFYKNLINLLDTNNNKSSENDNIMTLDDFSFEIFSNDDYDIYYNIVNDPYYEKANDEEKSKIYDTLVLREYNEYKKDPTLYLLSHKSN